MTYSIQVTSQSSPDKAVNQRLTAFQFDWSDLWNVQCGTVCFLKFNVKSDLFFIFRFFIFKIYDDLYLNFTFSIKKK